MATITGNLEIFANDQSLAYPSANAINGGELNSEENIRNIVTRISTKSFVIKRLPNADDIDGTSVGTGSDAFDLYKGEDNTTLYIAPGECNIRGYYFRCKTQTSINLTSYIGTSNFLTDLYNNWDNYLESDSTTLDLYVYLNVMKDGSDHILSYTAEDVSYSNFRGVVVTLTNTKTSTYDLLLGTINVAKDSQSSSFIINTVTNNDNKYTFIDANDIFSYDSDTQSLLSLEEVIVKLIQKEASGNIYDNVTIFGPTTSTDNTTNIFITDTSAEKLFRIYYNPNNNVGGLALYSGSLDSNNKVVVGSLITSLLTFTNLPVSSSAVLNTILTISTSVTISKNLIVNGDLRVDGSSTLYGNITIGSTTNTSNVNLTGTLNILSTTNGNGTIITDSQVKADKVYGAVWG